MNRRLVLAAVGLCSGILAQTIEGIVVDAATNAPIRKARLSLIEGGRVSLSRPSVPAATSDSGGHFTFAGVPPGSHTLFVSALGYSGTSQVFTFKLGDSIRGATLKLPPQGVVSGRVLDEDGDPVANVTVEVFDWYYYRGKRQRNVAAAATTDDRGEYRASGLPPGCYFVGARPRNRSMDPILTHSEAVFIEAYYPGVDAVSEAAQIAVEAGVHVRDRDIRMRRRAGFSVPLRLTGLPTPSPLTNIDVSLWSTEYRDEFSGSGFTARRLDDEGHFVASGVPAGSYRVSAEVIGNGHAVLFGQAYLVVNQSPLEEVSVAMSKGRRLDGILRLDSAHVIPDDVNVALSGWQSLPRMPLARPGRVLPDGRFSIIGFANGLYRFEASSTFGGYARRVLLNGVDVTESALDFRSNSSNAELVVDYSTDTGSVSGTVEAEQAYVVAVPEVKRRAFDRFYYTVPAAAGKFEIKSMAPGDYRVFAFDDLTRAGYAEPEWFRNYESKGERVSVKAGGNEPVRLKLIRTGSE